MRAQARQYADAVDSQNTTDPEANTWLNQSLAQLWGKLTKLDAQRFMVTSTLTPNDALEYDLADATVFAPTAEDFMSIVGVDWMHSGGRFPLEPFAIGDREVGSLRTLAVGPVYGLTSSAARYAIRRQGVDGAATRLAFDVAPPAGTYEMHYIQAPPELTSDLDRFDGVAGFEEWAILRVAILIAQREQSDISALTMLWRDAEAEVAALGSARDVGRNKAPAKVWRRDRGGRRGMWPYR